MAEGTGDEAVGANRPTVFISYASQDAAVANTVVGALERAGLRCWIAPRDVVPGALYADEIVRAINESSVVVLVLSAQSVVSPHVGKELERASSKRRRIIALRTDAAALPRAFEYFLSESQWIEVGTEGIEPATAKLAEAVRRHLGSGTPSPPDVANDAHATHTESRKHARRGATLSIAALLVIAVAAAAAWKLWLAKPATTTSAASAATAEGRSIAVMPFANLTGDPGKDYLGDGMSEELLNVLAKVPGLKVPSRTSSFAYKGRNTDLKQIANDLHVGTILEGSVRSAGETIRVTAQLIDARTDTHLWSETYDRKFTDLFKLQDELARAIVQALQVNLNGASPASIAQAPPTQDVEAYQLYLKGWSLGLRSTEKELREAIVLLQQALARDPGFARAWAGLAEVHVGFVVIGYPLPNALQDAEREAARAIALDPSLAGANAVLGNINAFHGHWIKAETLFRNAISQDASDPVIRLDYSGNLLDSLGRLRRSLEERLEGYRLAPADPLTVMNLAIGYSLIGRDAEALKYADLAVQIGIPPDVVPMPQIYANADVRSGRFREAAERIVGSLPVRMRAVGGDVAMRNVYAALEEPSRKASASVGLQKVLKKIKGGDLDVNARKLLIETFTQLDDIDMAYGVANQSLDEFARTGTVGSSWGVLWLPEMRAFRRDVRFQAFATRLGLMDYWTLQGPPDDCDFKAGKLTCH